MKDKREIIYEMPVYCGAMKVWRVLNLHSGTIYSMNFPTFEKASKSIKSSKNDTYNRIKVEIPEICNLLVLNKWKNDCDKLTK
jgi:hypothetical protein